MFTFKQNSDTYQVPEEQTGPQPELQQKTSNPCPGRPLLE